MTKSILHAIKKLLRISVLLLLIGNMSESVLAQGGLPGLCTSSCNSQVNVSLDGSGLALIDPALVWEEGFNVTCFQYLESVVVTIEGSTPVQNDVTLWNHTVSTTAALLDCSFAGQNVEYSLTKYYLDGTVNECWGNVLIEDKMKPNITCSDLFIYCNDPTDPYQLAGLYNNSIPDHSDNCGNVTLSYEDSETDYGCSHSSYLKKITRTWTATDDAGNEKTCTQYIYIQKVDGSYIEFPENLDGIDEPALACQNADTDPSNTGYPTLYGRDIESGDLCKLSIDYQDLELESCGGGYKIIRTWTILDWCTSDIYSHQQVIKVADNTPPVISCPSIPDIGTTTTSCSGNVNLPPASISDVCSGYTVTTETPNGTLNSNGGLVYGLPLGDHEITYTATDECGNSSSCSVTITVVDNIPPAAICDQHTNVSLLADGTVTVYAQTFDDGSHDNCELVNMEVRRMSDACHSPQQNDFDSYAEFLLC